MKKTTKRQTFGCFCMEERIINSRQLNKQFYAKRELVGTKGHCICEDCIFYAEQIIKNEALVELYI